MGRDRPSTVSWGAGLPRRRGHGAQAGAQAAQASAAQGLVRRAPGAMWPFRKRRCGAQAARMGPAQRVLPTPEAQSGLQPAGRPDRTVRARRHEGGHVCDRAWCSGCVQAGLRSSRAFVGRSIGGWIRSRTTSGRRTSGFVEVSQPRESAQDAVLRDLQRRQALPTAHARPAGYQLFGYT